jgi:hypothetical protein
LRSHLDGFTAAYEVQFRLRGNGSGYRSMLSRGRVVARNDRGDATRMIGTMLDLTGRPPSAANYGLAIERSAWPQDLHRQPFHAVLGGTAEAAVAGRAAGSPRPSQGLVELVDDLLDAALRDAKAAA